MGPYNGFSGDQRRDAQVWLNIQWRKGALPRPSKCCACGQTHGVLDAHAEDYSEPYGPHLQEFELCFFCHLMAHSRWRGPKRWAEYRAKVREGFRAPPVVSRDLGVIQRFLGGWEPEWIKGEVPTVPVLDQIDIGVYDPRRNPKSARYKPTKEPPTLFRDE